MTTPEPTSQPTAPNEPEAPGKPAAVGRPPTSTPNHHGHDVFVSYSSGDKPVADAVVARLEQAGIRCWVAPRDVLPGTAWGEAIVDAIGAARLMVLVLSGAANESRQVVREVELAASNNVVIVPFRIESVVPTGAMAYFLASEHWLDAMSPPLEAHIGHLVGVAEALLGRAAVPSAVPPTGAGLPSAPAGTASGIATPSPATPAQPTPASPWAAARGGGFHPSRTVVGLAVGAIALAVVGGALAMSLGRGAGPSTAPSVPSSASAIGSLVPTSGPTASTGPAASPRYASLVLVRALTTLAPLSLQTACETAELAGLEIAAITCVAPDVRGVTYELYATTADLDSDWRALVTSTGVVEGSGGCSNNKAGEDAWHFGTSDTNEGRVACYLGEGSTATLVWTDASIRTRVWIFGSAGATLESLYGVWKQGELDPSREVAALVTGRDGHDPIIPADLRSDCQRDAEKAPQAAAVHCFNASSDGVAYVLYATRADLDADWTTLREAHGLAVNGGGRCSDGVTAESSWSYSADPDTTIRGRLLCATADGGAIFSWTQFAALTRVTIQGDTIAHLRDRWAGGTLDPVAPTS